VKSGPKRKGILKQCVVCEKQFYRCQSRISQKYCSQKCMGIASRKDKSRICPTCGQKFKYKVNRQKYCSLACRPSLRVYKKCVICHTVFWSKRSTRKTCSLICTNKYHSVKMLGHKAFGNNDLKGSNNPNWKGGITPKNLSLRTSKKYIAWRQIIFERDKFTCQRCGDKKGGNLHAHHIKSFSKYPKIRLKIENGITLCEKCHKKIHMKSSKNRQREI